MISNPRYDLIQKLIADLSRVFAKLLSLPEREALGEIRSYYQDWLNLEYSSLKLFAPEQLLDYLVQEKELSHDELELLAALLNKEGEILHQGQQFSTAKDHLRKALVIFDYVEEHSQVFSFQRRQNLENTKRLLKDISSNHDL